MTDDELKELARTILYDIQRTHNSADAVRTIVDILRPYLQRQDVDKTNPTGSRFVSAADLDWRDVQLKCGNVPLFQIEQCITQIIKERTVRWPPQYRAVPQVFVLRAPKSDEIETIVKWPGIHRFNIFSSLDSSVRDVCEEIVSAIHMERLDREANSVLTGADLFWLHTDTQCGEIPGSQLLQIIDACIESYMPIWPAEFREQPRIRTIQDKGGCEVSVVWPNLLSYRWLFDPQTPARDVCRFVIQQLHLLIQEHQQQENGHGDI